MKCLENDKIAARCAPPCGSLGPHQSPSADISISRISELVAVYTEDMPFIGLTPRNQRFHVFMALEFFLRHRGHCFFVV